MMTSKGKGGWLETFQSTIVDKPWLCIFVTLLVVLCSSYGLSTASYNNDPKHFFDPQNPDLIFLNEIEQRFTSDENIVFIIAPKNKDIFTQRNLILLESLTEDAWGLPKCLRVDSITNFQHSDVDGDDLNIYNLVDEAAHLEQEQIDKIKHIALNEPNLVYNTISPSGHVATINVTVTLDKDASDAPAIMTVAQKLRDEYKKEYPDINFLMSGTVAFKQAQQQATEQELSTTSMYGMLAIIICLYIMLRSVVSVVLTLIIITLSNLSALGITSWMGVQFSPTIGLAPAMILTLAVADSIHILITYQQNIRSGLSQRDAMFESLRINMQPVFLTSVTTAVGFLFLNSSESPPFREMGNMVSIGVMMALMLSVVFLPAMVMVLPKLKYKKGMKDNPLVEKFASFVINKHKPLLIVMVLVSSALTAAAFSNDFNDIWFKYYDETFEVRRGTEFMIEEVTGFHRIQFAFPSGEENGIMDVEFMNGLDKFVVWAREHPDVLFVNTFSDTIKRLNRDMNRGESEYYSIPEQRDLIAQYVLMFELSLPWGLGLENQIEFDKSAVRVDVLLGKVSSNDIIDFEVEAREWMNVNLPKNMHTQGSGFDLLLGALSISSMKSMLIGTALAMIVVAAILVVALKSLKYGLLSMLPNLFPAILSFGVWGLLVGHIGLSVSVVACMTLGIVVDNSVHLLAKYIRAKQENGYNTEDALRYAIKTVGVALSATTLVLAANFGVMASSHFYPNASMGLLTAITVVVALIVNFFFFIPVLLMIDRSKEHELST